MHKRSIGILLVISMLMGFHVRAAADETTNTFTVINTNPATVYQLYANDSARSGIWYPAHNRSLETFADSEFSNGYTFMQNGVNGANTWDNNALQFLFDTPAFGENYQLQPYDVVYFSFYYKNASSFEMNGTTYNGTNEPANFHVKLGGENSKGRAMYNINSRDKAVPNRATSKLYCPSDDEWHKAEVAYMVSASLTDAQKQYITDYTAGKMLFTIDFTSSAEPMKIQFSDFTIGLMKFDPSAYTAETQSAYCTEARAVTELGKILERKTGLRALNCEGYDIPVVDENGEMLETLSIPMASENAEISIAAANPALHYLSNNGGNAYTLHVFSPGYDRTKADDAVKTYLAFTDLTANGITGSSCNAGLYHRAETANGTLNQRFSVNIVPVFKLFDASEVVHNTTSDSRDVTIDFSKGYNRSIETFDDGLKGYSMRFLKNDGTKGTVSEDNNYLQFDFDIGDYALKKNDTVFYTFYIRADGDDGGEGYVTKLSYSHIQNGERIKMFMGTKFLLHCIIDLFANYRQRQNIRDQYGGQGIRICPVCGKRLA